jgi:hypothetical protein
MAKPVWEYGHTSRVVVEYGSMGAEKRFMIEFEDRIGQHV